MSLRHWEGQQTSRKRKPESEDVTVPRSTEEESTQTCRANSRAWETELAIQTETTRALPGAEVSEQKRPGKSNQPHYNANQIWELILELGLSWT